jgi:excisionase family DNA binding protein
MNDPRTVAGLTVADVAKRYRVSKDKIRTWIKSGHLPAINTASALCGRPRFVVTPDALAAFERGRTAGKPKKQARRRKRAYPIDFFPD